MPTSRNQLEHRHQLTIQLAAPSSSSSSPLCRAPLPSSPLLQTLSPTTKLGLTARSHCTDVQPYSCTPSICLPLPAPPPHCPSAAIAPTSALRPLFRHPASTLDPTPEYCPVDMLSLRKRRRAGRPRAAQAPLKPRAAPALQAPHVGRKVFRLDGQDQQHD